MRPPPPCPWRPPPNPETPPRLGALRKGQQVYRRGLPAEVMKVDYEADPPALVVRMRSTGNEVGTDSAHVSLGLEASLRCLAVGVRVCVVDLQARTELNGRHGTLLEFRPDLGRWQVSLVTGNEVVAIRPQHLSVLLTPETEEPPAISAVNTIADPVKPSEESPRLRHVTGQVCEPAEELGPPVWPRDAVVPDISSAPGVLNAFSAAPREPAATGLAELQRPATIVRQQMDVPGSLTCEDVVAFDLPTVEEPATGPATLAARMVETPRRVMGEDSFVAAVPPVLEVSAAEEAVAEVGATESSQRPATVAVQHAKLPCTLADEGAVAMAAPAAEESEGVRQGAAAESGV